MESFPFISDGLCNIPDLPDARGRHTISLLESTQTLVVCGGPMHWDSCISWKQGQTTWSSFATLDPVRVDHSAVSFGDRLLLIGGTGESGETGVELPTGRIFPMHQPVSYACLIPQTEGFIVTGGLHLDGTVVDAYSSTGDFVSSLPSFVEGRRGHGCGSFVDGDGANVLLIAGGREIGTDTDYLSILHICPFSLLAQVFSTENVQFPHLNRAPFMTVVTNMKYRSE